MSAGQWGRMLKDMESEVSAITTIDIHVHFLTDFYRDALLAAGLHQADGIARCGWQSRHVL